MIYGNLPYDVRHKEAEKFSNDETRVIVATDAIGMGLNMPIKRVVFLRTGKFDGTMFRNLQASEIQQIAGRAGRQGIFDIGYYSDLSGNYDIDIKSEYESELTPIHNVTISMPKTLVGLNVSLSKILERWRKTEGDKYYIKANIDEEIKLCNMIEQYSQGKKHLLYELITIPFSTKEYELLDIWESLSLDVLANKEFDYKKFIPRISKKTSLNGLETSYKICDLLYYFNYKFYNIPEISKELTDIKHTISELTIEKLDKGIIEIKTCSCCGKQLPWNHQYNICQNCYYSRGSMW